MRAGLCGLFVPSRVFHMYEKTVEGTSLLNLVCNSAMQMPLKYNLCFQEFSCIVFHSRGKKSQHFR